MITSEQIQSTIEIVNNQLNSKEVQDYKPQQKYLEGQLEVLQKYRTFLDLDINLTHKDCLEFLNSLYKTAQRLQIDLVGFANNTGKPNLDGCFYLGKMIACNRLKNNLLNN